MEKTITYNNAYNMVQTMGKMNGVGNHKFNHGVNINIERLQELLKIPFKDVKEPSEEHKKYIGERQVVINAYREEVNKSKQEKKDLPNKDEHVKELDALDKKYESAIKDFQEKEEFNKKLFEKECGVDFYMVPLTMFPDMPRPQQRILMPFTYDDTKQY